MWCSGDNSPPMGQRETNEVNNEGLGPKESFGRSSIGLWRQESRTSSLTGDPRLRAPQPTFVLEAGEPVLPFAVNARGERKGLQS